VLTSNWQSCFALCFRAQTNFVIQVIQQPCVRAGLVDHLKVTVCRQV